MGEDELARQLEAPGGAPATRRSGARDADSNAPPPDLQRQAAMEAALRRQERLLDAIFHNILAQVAFLDRNLNFVRVNTAYVEGCGHTEEEMIGRNHFDLFPNQENEVIFRRVLETGEPFVARARSFVFADQPERGVTYWDWWLRPIRGPEGEAEGLVLSLADVTSIERARRDVERLNAELAEASAAKDRFLSVVSHELRNPLSAILAGVQVLCASGEPDPRRRAVLDIIERGVRLQTRLVNDLLDLSRLTQERLHLKQEAVDLESVVREAARAQQADADAAGVALRVAAEPGLRVPGDADRLHQVVLNLLSNAIKFTPKGGRVRVRCFATNARCSESPTSNVERRTLSAARIVVEDTGIGISAELLPRLFEMFRQGETGGSRRTGLGIGLALVKGLVERHGGRVRAESEGPGKGSRFVVDLPCPGDQETSDERAGKLAGSR
ncbi:MAG: PAS domain-containing sensor histidine kinase [Armatimonadetes bacterium]|nr:PAS domain-containing sensor histidine kinase [Armatimonadota bacterium]